MEKSQNRLEVCLSPAIYDKHADDHNIVVIVDILRATSTICAAIHNGVKSIIPVATVEEAREMKQQGYMVASERDGYVLDFADFGNSPFNFTPEIVGGKEIVYSTTNGTRCIHLASHSKAVVIGSFLNISVLTNWLIQQNAPILIFCASWKDRFSLEDTVYAGALAERLMNSGKFETICDGVTASIDLWSLAKNDLFAYIQKAAQKSRLASKGLDDCIEYCLTDDLCPVIPIFQDEKLVDILKPM
ncbi:2-phosphosulfolactate phosphatase [Aquipluma nitroreducens]|uniref:Probable 2-phosphosulfolactate phosphatase n=1 Tax=Aquipluma nitroreducens TaxID=2010828 RepID=A0A5K7S617_9BACT|nr:2-phosphosulfolactate phosphatase [Aquipluma nitroreducens]BBE16969.1 2-phosphosulfolactate phosphatase [Aquipluma nitroreducens]